MPIAVLAPLPLVALLSTVARDRSRRIEHAHDRLEALKIERRRREAAVQRLGDAFATNLDLESLLDLVGRSATEALDGAAGRATELRGPDGALGRATTIGHLPAVGAALLTEVEQRALSDAGTGAAEADGVHAIAGVIGEAPDRVGVVSVVRATPFSAEERSLVVYLCGQAAVSAANMVHHELLRDAEAKLRHQAFHDGLTQLANRALFADRVSHALERHARDPQHLAVLFLDLDGFKLVNDTLGHDAGDELLVTIAAADPRLPAARRHRGAARRRRVRRPARGPRRAGAGGRRSPSGCALMLSRADPRARPRVRRAREHRRRPAGRGLGPARACCARPTSRCTRPRAAAATASSASSPRCS